MALIQTLQLHHFRNIQQATLHLSPGLNVIVGDNAAGKTSIIEALWVLASGRSFRTQKPQQMIGNDQADMTLFCEVSRLSQTHKLGLKRDPQNIELRLDGKTLRNQTELAQYLPIQLLTPESHRLLEEGPKARRQFIDWGCFYHHPNFIQAWRTYQRALKQRNQSLKRQLPRNQIRLWDQQLIESALHINELRSDYIQALNPYLMTFIEHLMPELSAEIETRFYPGWPANQLSFEACLSDQFTRDLQLGHTQYGCHRADIRFRIQQQEPLVSLSRGQQKLFVCALLLAQASYLQQQTQDSVIMLIDDLPAELDATHRLTLLSLLQKLRIQHLVTTTAADLIPNLDPSASLQFEIRHGQISPLEAN